MAPSKTKLPVMKVPFKQPGQCDVSWEVLKPVLGYVSAKDPTMSRRKTYLSRTGLIVRVDVPAGLVLGSFDPEVSPDGKQLIFTGFMDQLRYDPHHVLGDILCHSDDLIMGMEKRLTKQWTFVKNKCKKTSEGAEIRDYKQYTITLPDKAVEQDFQNPLRDWDLNKIGVKGCLNKCPATRDTFYYLFLFTEESKHATPARALTNNLMYMDETLEDNPMFETNLARNNFEIQQYVNDRLKSPKKKKSRRHSRSRKSVLEESFASMSIVNSDDDDDNSTIESRFTTPRRSHRHRQEISNNIDETESQY